MMISRNQLQKYLTLVGLTLVFSIPLIDKGSLKNAYPEKWLEVSLARSQKCNPHSKNSVMLLSDSTNRYGSTASLASLITLSAEVSGICSYSAAKGISSDYITYIEEIRRRQLNPSVILMTINAVTYTKNYHNNSHPRRSFQKILPYKIFSEARHLYPQPLSMKRYLFLRADHQLTGGWIDRFFSAYGAWYRDLKERWFVPIQTRASKASEIYQLNSRAVAALVYATERIRQTGAKPVAYISPFNPPEKNSGYELFLMDLKNHLKSTNLTFFDYSNLLPNTPDNFVDSVHMTSVGKQTLANQLSKNLKLFIK